MVFFTTQYLSLAFLKYLNGAVAAYIHIFHQQKWR